ncbi:cache domain-containing protein [Thermodesulfobacteriota bacterium]
MKFSLKTKLIASFLTVIVIPGVISTAVGVYLIDSGIVREAQGKVALDLNSARQFYQHRFEHIKTALIFIAAQELSSGEMPAGENQTILTAKLEAARIKENLDFLAVTDNNGIVRVRSRSPAVYGDSQSDDEIVGKALRLRVPAAHTQILPREKLVKESPDLAKQARIWYVPTPHSRPTQTKENTSGMVMKAAIPLLDEEGNLLGVLYGGVLINRDFEIVDKIKEIVYQGVKYEGKDIGTATIFQEDLRISTNVMLKNGERAIGTRVSSEVYDLVIGKGKIWTARAFVVNDWYLTAYSPIRNADGTPIGMLYVGILEKKYSDMKANAFWIFLGVTCAGITLVLFIAGFIANTMIKPVQNLKQAAGEIEKGNFEYPIDVTTTDEIGDLTVSFKKMCLELKNSYEKLQGKIEAADEDLKIAYRELKEKQELLVQKEKLASVGQLSAGVAHEINNPLGTILVFSHMLLKEMPLDDPKRRDIEMIVSEADRCKSIVRGLLDFARQSKISKSSTDPALLINEVISIMNVKAQEKNVVLTAHTSDNILPIDIDFDQFKQMLVNLVNNGIDAVSANGEVSISARNTPDGDAMEVIVSDNGCGIPEENIPNLFTPFFTTKEMGTGTGLGLAIAYGVVKMHSGNITVKSRPGEGATFTVWIPYHMAEG